LSVYDKEHLYLNFLTKIFQKSSSITRIYKTVIFPQIDRYVYSISHSVPEFGANMAQVTLWKFFSGVPKFDGEGENHVTEDELLDFMLYVV
jgi:hypothetical protein